MSPRPAGEKRTGRDWPWATRLIGRISGLPAGSGVAVLAALLPALPIALGAASGGTAGSSTQAAAQAEVAPAAAVPPDPRPSTLVLVSWPGAERARWLDADGVPGRRGVDRWERQGWLLRPHQMSAEEFGCLDSWAARAGDDLLWIGSEAATATLAASRELRAGAAAAAAGPVRAGALPFGSGSGSVLLRWEGVPAADLASLRRESQAWLGGGRRLRWEEAVEILDLNPRENRAFQILADPANPFFGLRSTFVSDKASANLGIYLLGTRAPRVLAWRMDLVRAFEGGPARLAGERLAAGSLGLPGLSPAAGATVFSESVPWLETLTEEWLHEARNRLFCGRVLASRGRIYGRCDRILLSLAAESATGTLLVVDGRASCDPFVAVLRVGETLPPAQRRGSALAEALRPAWGMRLPAPSTPALPAGASP